MVLFVMNCCHKPGCLRGDVKPSGVSGKCIFFKSPSCRQWCSLSVSKLVLVESGPLAVWAERNPLRDAGFSARVGCQVSQVMDHRPSGSFWTCTVGIRAWGVILGKGY